jgi:hypothetical protein
MTETDRRAGRPRLPGLVLEASLNAAYDAIVLAFVMIASAHRLVPA